MSPSDDSSTNPSARRAPGFDEARRSSFPKPVATISSASHPRSNRQALAVHRDQGVLHGDESPPVPDLEQEDPEVPRGAEEAQGEPMLALRLPLQSRAVSFCSSYNRCFWLWSSMVVD